MTKQEYQAQYRAKHKERLREYFRLHYLGSKTTHNSNTRAYYKQHRESILRKQRIYHAANRSAIGARMKEYQKSKPHIWRRNVANYKTKYPSRVKASKKKYSDAHKFENTMRCKERRARIRTNGGDSVAARQFYSWIKNQEFVSCTYCGIFVSGDNIHIDHIIPVSRGGTHEPNNFCVACSGCNIDKSDKLLAEWGKCPDKFKDN